jgi:hypothetical protein
MWAAKLTEQTSNVTAGQFSPYGDIPGNREEIKVFSSAINIREIRVAQSAQLLGYGPEGLGFESRKGQVIIPYCAMFTPDMRSTQPPM